MTMQTAAFIVLFQLCTKEYANRLPFAKGERGVFVWNKNRNFLVSFKEEFKYAYTQQNKYRDMKIFIKETASAAGFWLHGLIGLCFN
jgi:hypothetical protein